MSAADNDSMCSLAKKPRPGPASSGFIRLCDAFVRGDAGVICPTGIAEESVRVAFKLQRELLETVLKETGRITGLRLRPPEWFTLDPDQKNGGNIFIPYDADEEVNGEIFKEQFRAQSEAKELKVKNYLLDILPTKSPILQPVISERDFNQYKMQLCCENLLDSAGKLQSAGLKKNNDLLTASENIKSQLEDLKENRIKIGVLSHNGRGKSFILNLLFLLTADTDNDYMNNNKNMILPKDIQEDPTIEELEDNDIQRLPRVIQDVITKIRKNETNKDNRQHFHEFTEALLVHELGPPSEEDIKRSKDSLSELKDYSLMNKRIKIDSYVLPQKEIDNSYDSTTKCVMQLRYGPLYQMKIEYFKAEDLQCQLFELQSLIDGTYEGNNDKYTERSDRSCECLKARLALLTDFNGDGNDDDDDEIDDEKIKNFVQTWNSAEDVKLSDEVEAFAGKTELHIGNGKNATDDRLALKAVFMELITSQGKDGEAMRHFKKKLAAVKKIVVYLPAKILIGKEILEMPGMESDPMVIHCINNALEKVDVLFLLSENGFKIGEKEVKEILVESKFLKNMLNDPENYKLMLLTYPEKQSSWDLKIIAGKTSETWKHEEETKRKKEIKALRKLITDKTLLSKLNEDSIITSYICPLMYTSIYSQEGEPRDIIENNNTIIKLTGITELIIQLDKLSAKKQENSVLEVTGQLERQKVLSFENAEKVVSLWKTKDNKNIHEENLAKDNESALIRVRKDLEKILYEFVGKKISDILSHSEAKERWLENEHGVTKIAMFNPFYGGKHHCFKVKIYNILFGDVAESAKPLFTTLIEDLNKALSTYQKEAIKVCVDRLVELSQATSESTEQFVEKSVNGLLEDAKAWYLGKTHLPINEQKLGKYLDESLKMGLKEEILKPAYDTKDLSEAKKIVTRKIRKATDYAKGHFLDILINQLHQKRVKCFSGKLKNKKETWRTWQLLMSKCTIISKNEEIHFQKGEFTKAVTLMSTSLYDVPECQGP